MARSKQPSSRKKKRKTSDSGPKSQPPTKNTRSKPRSKAPVAAVDATIAQLKLGQPGCRAWTEDGLSYIVSSAVPGDKVRIKPMPERKNAPPAAHIVALNAPSSDRIHPPCVLLNRCGGCSIQAMQYTQQLAAKYSALRKMLEPLEPAYVLPVEGLTHPFGYRTRLLMQAAPHPRGRGFQLGFYERGTTRIVVAAGCPVQHPLTLAVTGMVQQILADAPINASVPQSDKGWLHGISVRIDPTTGLAELTLAARTKKIPGHHVLERLAALPAISGIHIAVNKSRSSYLYDGRFVHIAGQKRTAFMLGGEAFHLSPGAFFQTSAEGAERLVTHVLAMLPESFETLADLYGGVGVFARLSAKRWKRALVAESNPQSLEDLRSYLRHSGEQNIQVIEGRVEHTITQVSEANPDVVILDPPRGGCHPKVIDRLGRAKPKTIIYVACGIESFVRDGAMLQSNGYRLDRVSSVDMFPHTTHLEVVARFTVI